VGGDKKRVMGSNEGFPSMSSDTVQTTNRINGTKGQGGEPQVEERDERSTGHSKGATSNKQQKKRKTKNGGEVPRGVALN